jgi:hypothetical protein
MIDWRISSRSWTLTQNTRSKAFLPNKHPRDIEPSQFSQRKTCRLSTCQYIFLEDYLSELGVAFRNCNHVATKSKKMELPAIAESPLFIGRDGEI